MRLFLALNKHTPKGQKIIAELQELKKRKDKKDGL